MYQKLIHFIKYHNAFNIIFVVVFLGFGMSYAASPEVRESVYSSTETIVSVDNTLIVSSDLDSFSFDLKINSITEDETNYYANYGYQTLAIGDSVWQNKWIDKTLKVNKKSLEGKDFGLYVAKELGENMDSERAYLKRVQKLEKEKGESRKMVAVEYSGLIGKFLNPRERVIDGYSPIIPEPTPTPEPTPLPIPNYTPTTPAETSMPASTPTPEPTSVPTPTETSIPTPTPVETPVSTPTETPTPTPVPETTPTPTPVETPTPTPIETPVPTPTPEPTPIETPIPTPVETPVPTPVETPIPIPEPTPTEIPPAE